MNDRRARRALRIVSLSSLVLLGIEASAHAQQTPMGVPPPEAKAVVEAPKGIEAPKLEKKTDGTTASVSAGGLLTTGNSRLLAMSGNGIFESRYGANGFGASLLGNYGQGAPAGGAVHVTTQNFQGRVRYDRYLVDELGLFLINTGRHDRFQGLAFRYNLDPGVKYLFITDAAHPLWAELGYDFQYDIRRDDDRVLLDADKKPVVDPVTGQPTLIDKTAADHSIRAFVGHKEAFNKEVTLALGLEYLQSVVDTDRYRFNGDALFAAKVGGGLAVGLGVSLRYDHQPLAGKEKLDTATTISLIYAFSDAQEVAKATCPCPEPEAPPPPPPPAPLPPPVDVTPPPVDVTPTPTPTPAPTENP